MQKWTFDYTEKKSSTYSENANNQFYNILWPYSHKGGVLKKECLYDGLGEDD
jgi:hypothetical protein